VKLEVGSASESINVDAQAIAVQSQSSEVSDVISGEQVSQLATTEEAFTRWLC